MSNFELWLEFEIWHQDNNVDPEDDFFNMQITFADGRKYALNVWTYKFFERAQRWDQKNGDSLDGKYLLPPDLFIERLDRELIENIVTHLLQTGGLRNEWLVQDDD